MIEIQHILDQEPVDVEGGDEEFIDPLTNTFAHRNSLPCCRGAMSGHNHTDTRQALAEVGSQPPSNSSTTSPVFMRVTLAVGG